MQAVSMIETMTMNETVAPAKPVETSEPKGKSFGQVVSEKSSGEPRRHRAENVQTDQREQQPVATKEQPGKEVQHREEVQPQVTETTEGRIEVVSEAAPAPKLQQTLVQLMKVIASGESDEATSEFGSVEDLLGRLVEQLEGTELEGEQVLAGIDLSALAQQLQQFTEQGDGEQLTQLAQELELQLNQQLATDQGLEVQTEVVAAPVTDNAQNSVAPTVENLAQARQILQQAIDKVAAAQPGTTSEATESAVDDGSQETLLSGAAAEEIDPRFAGLLKPRGENSRNQNSQGLQQKDAVGMSRAATIDSQTLDGEAAVQVASDEQAETTDFAQLLGQNGKGLDKLNPQVQGPQSHFAQVQNGAVRTVQTPVVQLPSGQQVAESQIFDQVVTHISGSRNGESGRMVLRLQPAELGSLKLELMVEGDRVKANLQAQSMQVQEVIERNLPQLRNALAEQGLKIDQFQVNIDKGRQDGQFENLAQQDQNREFSQPQGWTQDFDDEEQAIPLAHLMQNGGEGISLHV